MPKPRYVLFRYNFFYTELFIHSPTRSFVLLLFPDCTRQSREEERATFTRFDNELKKLECMSEGKKRAVSDADLQLKKYGHGMRALTKEKTAAVNFVANFEKQCDWVPDESE